MDEATGQFDPRTFITGPEFVNAEGFLDYAAPQRHTFAVRTHAALAGQMSVLVRATKACDAATRAAAVQLLNYAGEPAIAMPAVVAVLDDPDEGVRNNSARWVATFAAVLPESLAPRVLAVTCAKIERIDFLEMNTGLSALQGLLERHPGARREVPERCRAQVRVLAATSVSSQIGGFAKRVLKQLEP